MSDSSFLMAHQHTKLHRIERNSTPCKFLTPDTFNTADQSNRTILVTCVGASFWYEFLLQISWGNVTPITLVRFNKLNNNFWNMTTTVHLSHPQHTEDMSKKSPKNVQIFEKCWSKIMMTFSELPKTLVQSPLALLLLNFQHLLHDQ